MLENIIEQKSKYLTDTGYRVTITQNENIRVDQLNKAIQTSNVLDVSVESLSSNEVIYNLPLTETSKFPSLFAKLEANRAQLGIESIGVSCTTMEEVFLK